MRFITWLENREQRGSDAFRAWFGDSKVVDGQGNPLVVYTGTSKDSMFRSFRPGKGGLIWFTSDPESASSYADQNDSMGYKLGFDDDGRRNYQRTNTRSRVFAVYLKMDNPFIDINSPKFTGDDDQKQHRNYIAGKLKTNDGYIDVKNGIYVVGNSMQIKSAMGNKGTFSPKKKDIGL